METSVKEQTTVDNPAKGASVKLSRKRLITLLAVLLLIIGAASTYWYWHVHHPKTTPAKRDPQTIVPVKFKPPTDTSKSTSGGFP